VGPTAGAAVGAAHAAAAAAAAVGNEVGSDAAAAVGNGVGYDAGGSSLSSDAQEAGGKGTVMLGAVASAVMHWRRVARARRASVLALHWALERSHAAKTPAVRIIDAAVRSTDAETPLEAAAAREE